MSETLHKLRSSEAGSEAAGRTAREGIRGGAADGMSTKAGERDEDRGAHKGGRVGSGRERTDVGRKRPVRTLRSQTKALEAVGDVFRSDLGACLRSATNAGKTEAPKGAVLLVEGI